MTVGDVVSGIAGGVAGGATLDFQPAAGVEVVITAVGSEQSNTAVPGVIVGLYDGTDFAHVATGGEGGWSGLQKIFLNNTIYLRLENNSGSAGDIAYCGIQTK